MGFGVLKYAQLNSRIFAHGISRFRLGFRLVAEGAPRKNAILFEVWGGVQ